MDDISINLPNFDNLDLTNDGTDLGTFKSVSDLKQAYDELRSCFTKNAMELAKIKKENEGVSDKEITPDNVDKAEIAPTELHIWEKSDWNEKLENFVSQNPMAANFSTEITEMIQQDKEIENSNFPLQTAWIKVLENRVQSEKQSEPNLDMKERIIEDYLNTVKSSKSAPKVISSREGVNNISTPKRSLDNLDEAFVVAKKLFE